MTLDQVDHIKNLTEKQSRNKSWTWLGKKTIVSYEYVIFTKILIALD